MKRWCKALGGSGSKRRASACRRAGSASAGTLLRAPRHLPPLRSKRAALNAGTSSRGNHGRALQIQMAGRQLIDTGFGGRYFEAQMGELPGRRTRQGKLKGADVAQADAAVDLKISQREKQTSRKAPTFDAIRARQLKLSSAPTKHEAELMVVAAVCDNDRR